MAIMPQDPCTEMWPVQRSYINPVAIYTCKRKQQAVRSRSESEGWYEQAL